MRLLTLPTVKKESVEIPLPTGGVRQYWVGNSVSSVEIAVPKVDTPEDKTWNVLKHGRILQLNVGVKVDRLIFEEHDLILYDVMPMVGNYSESTDENIYTCSVDRYEVLE